MRYCPRCIAHQTRKGKNERLDVLVTFKALNPLECYYCNGKTKEVTPQTEMVDTATDKMVSIKHKEQV
jgi:hypothetical protein